MKNQMRRILSGCLSMGVLFGTLSTWSLFPQAFAKEASNRLPEAVLDEVESTMSKVHVRGWAYDPDDTGRPVEVRVFINGEEHTIQADTERADVDNAYQCGSYHGFDSWITTEQSGNVTVKVRALDVNDPSCYVEPQKRSISVTKNNLPALCVDDVRAEAGRVYVAGWAYDPDTTQVSVLIHVYIGDKGYVIRADQYRPDVDAASHCGAYHGFSAYLDTDQAGTQEVRIYAIDFMDPDRHTGAKDPYPITIPKAVP